MPFVNGRFYMNPAQGRAVERARIAQTTSDRPDSPPLDPDAHWVTINHRHIVIHEAQQGPVPSKPHRCMALSSKGLDFIKRHENYSSRLYPDSAGNLTIGYGHLIEGERTSPVQLQKKRRPRFWHKTCKLQSMR